MTVALGRMNVTNFLAVARFLQGELSGYRGGLLAGFERSHLPPEAFDGDGLTGLK